MICKGKVKTEPRWQCYTEKGIHGKATESNGMPMAGLAEQSRGKGMEGLAREERSFAKAKLWSERHSS